MAEKIIEPQDVAKFEKWLASRYYHPGTIRQYTCAAKLFAKQYGTMDGKNVLVFSKNINNRYRTGINRYLEYAGLEELVIFSRKRTIEKPQGLRGAKNMDGLAKYGKYKLCYVEDNIAYFTDNFTKARGEDWHKVPYEHNACPPCPEDNVDIVKVAFEKDGFDVQSTADMYRNGNGPWCVDDINAGAVAWLTHTNKHLHLKGGATLVEAVDWFRKCGILWGVLHE